MSNKKKAFIGVGVVAVLALFAVLALSSGRSDAVEVKTEEVGRRTLVSRVTATGHIEPETSVDISADVSGRIVELTVEEGQDVAEGELLMVIDPARFEAALERSLAGLADAQARQVQAKANANQAQRDWDRIRQLKESVGDLVTDIEYETARTQAEVQKALSESARHGVGIARASVSESRDQLSKTVIRAPISGRVTRLNVERGETAIVGTMNNPGSLLLTVSDLSVMEAVIEVDETDIPEIKLGDSTAVAIDAFPGREFTGVVTKIGNSSIRPRSNLQSSSDQAIDFEVRIMLEDPDSELRTDLSATADVITAVRPDVLAIPIIALTLLESDEFEFMPNENQAAAGDSEGAGSSDSSTDEETEEVEGVFVVTEGIARFQPVEIGIAGDNYFEVTDGLEEGATVISGSYQAIRSLKDGDEVKVKDEDRKADATDS
ncbi:MAG: efflux RND transporter periplasmic adaptor subunit [Gemmatimonadota bacterium]